MECNNCGEALPTHFYGTVKHECDCGQLYIMKNEKPFECGENNHDYGTLKYRFEDDVCKTKMDVGIYCKKCGEIQKVPFDVDGDAW